MHTMSSVDGGVLAGRTTLVTGASRGIGRAVAARFREAGAWVAMVARGEAALRAAAEEVDGHAVPADVSDAGSVHRLAAYLDEVLGGEAPDIVVNAAGAFELAPLAETDPESFDRHLAVNLRAPFLVIRAFLPAMLERGSGHVVTLGSVAGRQAFPHNGAYSASKFGVRGLHAVLDAELRGTGVRSTLVEPAATDTPLWDAIDFARHPGLPPREAMLSPDAVADAVVYAVTRPPEVDVRTIRIERV
ncbi:MAG TPA: SDR family oxidoreductase [Longimicrobiales bacterium]